MYFLIVKIRFRNTGVHYTITCVSSPVTSFSFDLFIVIYNSLRIMEIIIFVKKKKKNQPCHYHRLHRTAGGE